MLPPPAAPPDSAGLLPEAAASRVSLVRVAEDPPEPPAPLRPHPLPSLLSDYSEDDGDLRPAPVGGRLSLFLSEWQKITQDSFILSIISHGYMFSIPDIFPGTLREASATPSNVQARFAIRAEIVDLLLKNAIV